MDLLIWDKRELLLVKRKNHPLKGEWYVVGGRVWLGEEPIDAVHRKAREEVGLTLTRTRFIGYYSDIFTRNAFQKTESQTISLVFICGCKDRNVVLDGQSSAYKWSKEGMPERFAAKLMYS